jgi:hypothetical protein
MLSFAYPFFRVEVMTNIAIDFKGHYRHDEIMDPKMRKCMQTFVLILSVC